MTDPIRVTLSGNSTPLLPGCGECATLRQRLAEAEASRDTARGVADAFRDTISRATGNPDAVHGLMMLCESHEKLAEAEARAEDFKRIGQGFERDMRKHFQQSCANLQRAEKAQADAARWEGAARKIAEMYKAFRLCSMYTRTMDEHDADLTRAIAAEKAVDLDPTASALVREGGGGT
jgi:hypothetical protein